MRQPFSVNKLAKQHNRDSRTCVHWYFVKHFSKLSYHFFSRSKGCISNELRVFFKYILQDHAKTCQLFSQKVPSQIFAPSFFCLIDLLFFLVAVMFGFSFPGSFFISCSQSLHVSLKPIYFASVCDFFDLHCYNFISLLFCVHFS